MEYRNIIYYLIFFPSIIFLVGFPFYFEVGKSNIGIILYLLYVFFLTYIFTSVKKKYWSWILQKRRKKANELLMKKYLKIKKLEVDEYLNLKIDHKNVLLKFDFSNYPPHRFSVPKNILKIYIEKPDTIENYEKLKIININNQHWLYENKLNNYFSINRSIERLVKNSEAEIKKLIEKSR